MKRFLSIIAATAAAAAVAAAISLPAGADDGPRDELATFTSCLRTHGLDVPANLEPIALKQWLGQHEDSAGFQAAVEACDPKPDRRVKTAGPAPEQLVSCLRDHGLTPPSSIDELKPWTARQFETVTGKAALNACGLAAGPEAKAPGDGGCAAEKAAHPEKAKAATAKAVPRL